MLKEKNLENNLTSRLKLLSKEHHYSPRDQNQAGKFLIPTGQETGDKKLHTFHFRFQITVHHRLRWCLFHQWIYLQDSQFCHKIISLVIYSGICISSCLHSPLYQLSPTETHLKVNERYGSRWDIVSKQLSNWWNLDFLQVSLLYIM